MPQVYTYDRGGDISTTHERETMALLQAMEQEKTPTKPPCERTARAHRRSFYARISRKFLVEQRNVSPPAPRCRILV